MIAVYAPLAAAGFGVWLFTAGLRRPRRPRRLGRNSDKNGYQLAFGLILIVVGLLLSLLGLNIQSYEALSESGQVAQIEIKALYPVEKTFSVTVSRIDGQTRATTCILKGDLWGVSGTRQNWEWWTVLMGLDTTYAVQHIVSRSADAPAKATVSSCDISVPKPKLDLYLPGGLIRGLMEQAVADERPLDAAAFAPLTNGAVYKVAITAAGFAPEPQKP
jgi:hypothetical protein